MWIVFQEQVGIHPDVEKYYLAPNFHHSLGKKCTPRDLELVALQMYRAMYRIVGTNSVKDLHKTSKE